MRNAYQYLNRANLGVTCTSHLIHIVSLPHTFTMGIHYMEMGLYTYTSMIMYVTVIVNENSRRQQINLHSYAHVLF